MSEKPDSVKEGDERKGVGQRLRTLEDDVQEKIRATTGTMMTPAAPRAASGSASSQATPAATPAEVGQRFLRTLEDDVQAKTRANSGTTMTPAAPSLATLRQIEDDVQAKTKANSGTMTPAAAASTLTKLEKLVDDVQEKVRVTAGTMTPAAAATTTLRKLEDNALEKTRVSTGSTHSQATPAATPETMQQLRNLELHQKLDSLEDNVKKKMGVHGVNISSGAVGAFHVNGGDDGGGEDGGGDNGRGDNGRGANGGGDNGGGDNGGGGYKVVAEVAQDIDELVAERMEEERNALPSAVVVNKTMMQRYWPWLLLLAVIMVVVVVVSVVATGNDVTIPVTNVTATPAPTPAPTLGATTLRFTAFAEYFEGVYNYTPDVFARDGDYTNSSANARTRALQWLAEEDGAMLDLETTSFEDINQRYVLSVLYFSTKGDQWIDHTNWLSTFAVCSWEDVNCHSELSGAEKRLKEIGIDKNNMVGTIPSEIATLTYLTRFAVPSNKGLHGPLPTEFGRLSMLDDLSVGGTSLTGAIPSEIGLMKNITFMAITNSFFSGAIPSEMGQMAMLRSCFLANNSLTGTVPLELSQPTLKRLNVQHNDGLVGDLSPLYCNETTVSTAFPILENFISDCLVDSLACTCCTVCCGGGECCERDEMGELSVCAPAE